MIIRQSEELEEFDESWLIKKLPSLVPGSDQALIRLISQTIKLELLRKFLKPIHKRSLSGEHFNSFYLRAILKWHWALQAGR